MHTWNILRSRCGAVHVLSSFALMPFYFAQSGAAAIFAQSGPAAISGKREFIINGLSRVGTCAGSIIAMSLNPTTPR